MPKIMYRPNPTPPPFVPPVPPVPTEPYVTISPYPFGSDEPINCRIFNVVAPAEATYMIFDISDSDNTIVNMRVDIESPIVGEFDIQAVTLASSSNDMIGHIAFYSDDTELEEYPLVVYLP